MAGNKNSGKRVGGKDFSPRVRSLFDIAIKEALADGSLLKKLKQQLLEDPAGTIQRMAQYAPKQHDINVEQTVTVQSTEVSQTDMEIIKTLRAAENEHVTH